MIRVRDIPFNSAGNRYKRSKIIKYSEDHYILLALCDI
jgi:hypothetical protein